MENFPVYLERLGRILNAYVPVPPEEVGLVLENGSVEKFSKGEIIFSEKRFNGFEYFQFEGITHRFSTDADKEKLTTGLFNQEAVITPHFTRTNQGQSIFSLQALTDMVLLKVPAGTFSELMDKHPLIRRFGRSVVEKEFVRSLRYEVIFRSYSAKDRLLYFRETYPQLENIIPHTVIASFLGITPVSFSRLRAESMKG